MRLPDGRIRKRRRSSDDILAAHALTFTCFHGQRFLSSDRTCMWLAESIDRARAKHAFDLWAYVFMPNHVHLVLWPRSADFHLRAVFAAIKLPVSRRAVAYVKTHAGPFLAKMLDKQPNGQTVHRFWQRGGGYDRDLTGAGTIHATIDYIHANPLRARLVEQPELWRWSSASHFAGTATAPLTPDTDSIPDPPTYWRFRRPR